MRADEPMADALAAAALKRAQTLNKRLKRAREADPDSVHDGRTELRRARTLLDLMGRTVFDPVRTKKLERVLHDVERSLAKVRDSDVMLADIAAYLRDRPEARAGLDELARRLEQRRASAARRSRRVLARSARQALVRDARTLARSPRRPPPNSSPKAAPVLVRHFTHETVWTFYDELRAYDALAPDDADVLHAFRSRGRRMRYALEILAEALPETAPILDELVGLQQDVGSLHDHTVTLRLLHKWRARKVHDTPELRAYAQHHEQSCAVLWAQCRARYALLLGRAFRERIATALEVEVPAAA